MGIEVFDTDSQESTQTIEIMDYKAVDSALAKIISGFIELRSAISQKELPDHPDHHHFY